MTRALQYEWLRIKTIRSTYWISALAIGLTWVVTSLLIWGVNTNGQPDMNIPQVSTWVVTGGASAPLIPVLAAVFFAVMGAMAMGHEYRYGTNKATLTALPDRVVVFAAKVLVVAGWVIASVILIVAVNLLIASLFLHSFSLSGDAIRPIVNYILYCVGFALAGLGLATILRNQTGAIAVVLVWPLVIEPIINGVLTVLSNIGNHTLGKLANLLPASAGRRVIYSPYDVFSGFGTQSSWGILASLVVFWVGVGCIVAAGLSLFLNRDA